MKIKCACGDIFYITSQFEENGQINFECEGCGIDGFIYDCSFYIKSPIEEPRKLVLKEII